jgi:hypothetical protein
LDELWCVEYYLIEKGYTQPVELRDINAGHEALQVSADPFKHKICEDREDKACQGRWMSAFLVRERLRRLEIKG